MCGGGSGTTEAAPSADTVHQMYSRRCSSTRPPLPDRAEQLTHADAYFPSLPEIRSCSETKARPTQHRRAPHGTLLWLVSAEWAKSRRASSLLSLAARVALLASCPPPHGSGMLQGGYLNALLNFRPAGSHADCVLMYSFRVMLLQQTGSSQGVSRGAQMAAAELAMPGLQILIGL